MHSKQTIRARPFAVPRRRGIASVLAMMFLVIFGSLAAAMAVVSQGNLATADTHLKIGRALAAADTGMRFVQHHLHAVAHEIRTSRGEIDSNTASILWGGDGTPENPGIAATLVNRLATQPHSLGEPYLELIRQDANGNDVYRVNVGPISVGSGEPNFTATLTPHPLYDDDGVMIDYNAAEYDRPPYDGSLPRTGIDWDVSNANPLDESFVRLRVTAHDGPVGSRVYRSISMDIAIDKNIRYALLSRSRIMVGRNVMIEGPIGSTFQEVHLDKGHPVQMQSDFRGLHPDLDAALDALVGTLIADDANGDNRLNIYNPTEVESFAPDQISQWDENGDGYIDEYDLLLKQFDTDASGTLNSTELEVNASNPDVAGELFGLIDNSRPDRNGDGVVDSLDVQLGYNDGVIDNRDRYTKVRGEVYVTASRSDWNNGAADTGPGSAYQDYFQGSISPRYGEDPLTFGASQNAAYDFQPEDFNTDLYRDQVSESELYAEAGVGSLEDLPKQVEEVPYASSFPYDYYERPVVEGKTFTNVLIPRGANILFKNCTFIGVTFIETYEDNQDINYNYTGMEDASGQLKHPDRTTPIDGQDSDNSKTAANNIRFDNCTFAGSIVTDSPKEFTHVRNKLTFTGDTSFEDLTDPEAPLASTYLTEAERAQLARSSILAPHYSIEMGTFTTPDVPDEKVNLSGTIVAGLIDMRGNIDVRGTILTTFNPQSNTGPVLGETSPNFNTTLGYFTDEDGDEEVDELPENGMGRISVRYDPTLPLPDGIRGPIELRPIESTYREGGAP